MDILKYFYEEPAALEAVAADLDPDARGQTGGPRLSLEALLDGPAYHRGYLAGTDLGGGRVGLTALARPEAFVRPLVDWLGGLAWQRADGAGQVAALSADEAEAVLRRPAQTAVLVCSEGGVDEGRIAAAAEGERRRALPALRRLLDAARVVFFPERAHDGFDWSLFSSAPMREALTAAFRRYPGEGVRRFVLPYQKARSEQKFYFEQWQLQTPPLPDYIEEV